MDSSIGGVTGGSTSTGSAGTGSTTGWSGTSTGTTSSISAYVAPANSNAVYVYNPSTGTQSVTSFVASGSARSSADDISEIVMPTPGLPYTFGVVTDKRRGRVWSLSHQYDFKSTRFSWPPRWEPVTDESRIAQLESQLAAEYRPRFPWEPVKVDGVWYDAYVIEPNSYYSVGVSGMSGSAPAEVLREHTGGMHWSAAPADIVLGPSGDAYLHGNPAPLVRVDANGTVVSRANFGWNGPNSSGVNVWIGGFIHGYFGPTPSDNFMRASVDKDGYVWTFLSTNASFGGCGLGMIARLSPDMQTVLGYHARQHCDRSWDGQLYPIQHPFAAYNFVQADRDGNLWAVDAGDNGRNTRFELIKFTAAAPIRVTAQALADGATYFKSGDWHSQPVSWTGNSLIEGAEIHEGVDRVFRTTLAGTPVGLTLDRDGNPWVAVRDANSGNKLQNFDRNGNHIVTIDLPFAPDKLEFDWDGNLLVMTRKLDKIVKLTHAGTQTVLDEISIAPDGGYINSDPADSGLINRLFRAGFWVRGPGGSGPISTGFVYEREIMGNFFAVANPPPFYFIAKPNQRPVASAGADQTVIWNTSPAVTLDGSASFDPDNDPLSLRWEIRDRPAGSVASLSAMALAATSFVPDMPGSYTLALTVADAEFSSEDTVVVAAEDVNQPEFFQDEVTSTVGEPLDALLELSLSPAAAQEVDKAVKQFELITEKNLEIEDIFAKLKIIVNKLDSAGSKGVPAEDINAVTQAVWAVAIDIVNVMLAAVPEGTVGRVDAESLIADALDAYQQDGVMAGLDQLEAAAAYLHSLILSI